MLDPDSVKNDHIGFHFHGHDEKGIYFGRLKKNKKNRLKINENIDFKTEDEDTVECKLISLNTEITPYMLIKEDQMIPYCYYKMHGTKGHCPVSEFALRLKMNGIPLSGWMTRELTNTLVKYSELDFAFEEPGYRLTTDDRKISERIRMLEDRYKKMEKTDKEIDNEIKKEEDNINNHKITLIGKNETYLKFEAETKDEKSLDEVIPILKDLYDLTVDKRAFIIAFSYSLWAPLSSIVRKKRLFFPNLVFIGLPETGKNSLLNLFLAKMWSSDENIKVTGDFRTDFSTMKNLEGSGLPIVINDLDQQGYEKLKPFLLEGAMNARGGSRGRPSLDLQNFETLRGIAISANYLQIGGQESTSRFIVHEMKETNVDKTNEWNTIAQKLEGAMYPIARFFTDYLNKNNESVEEVLGYFNNNRISVKTTIIKQGANLLMMLFQKAGLDFKIPDYLFKYEEYYEDYISLFIGWVQLSLRKMQKETNYVERDWSSHETITVKYDDSLYIQQDGSKYIVFPMAFRDFLKKYPEFPFQSMDAFAHAYPQYLKSQPRKFRIAGAEDRKAFRVLVVENMAQEPSPEPMTKEKVS